MLLKPRLSVRKTYFVGSSPPPPTNMCQMSLIDCWYMPFTYMPWNEFTKYMEGSQLYCKNQTQHTCLFGRINSFTDFRYTVSHGCLQQHIRSIFGFLSLSWLFIYLAKEYNVYYNKRLSELFFFLWKWQTSIQVWLVRNTCYFGYLFRMMQLKGFSE